MVILWGIPGTGKSTFANWLRDRMGFEYVDTDELASRPPSSPLERAWEPFRRGLGEPQKFMTAAARALRPVVVEYGLWVTPDTIDILRSLRSLGAVPIWFDGDPAAAKQSWITKNHQIGRPFEDDFWDKVVAESTRNWSHVGDLFGGNIVRAVEAGPKHLAQEDIYVLTLGRLDAGNLPPKIA